MKLFERNIAKNGTKLATLLAIVLFTGYKSMAQNELHVDLGYNVNIPSGSSFRDFVKDPAYKGITGGLSYYFDKQWSVGLQFSYNDYYQKFPRQTYDDGKGNTISAVVSNSIQQMPMLLTADYALLKTGVVRPYIGVGAGVNFISFDQYLGEFDNPVSYTKWALRGEAGVLIPLSSYSSTALKIGGSYNYAPLNEQGIKNLNNWGIHAGISFALH